MKFPRKNRLRLLLGMGVLLLLAVWLFREPLREHLRNGATLANDAPPAEVVSEMIERAADPHLALLATWNSGKIMHRETAIREVMLRYPPAKPLPADIEELLLAGAVDPDMNVRESALGILQDRHDPALTALAELQFADPDSSVRMLGLIHLKSAPASIGVPLVAELLDDPDLQVTGQSLNLLERWSGEKFGARLVDTAATEDPQSGLLGYSNAGQARIEAARVRAKAWWVAHQHEFASVRLPVPLAARAAQEALPAKDFQLRTLQGDDVRLSAYRGKVVLINFWTTWCTACVGELPELVALQQEHHDGLVILGVSLDFVPDEDGDQHPDPAVARQKIARAVQDRGLNYPVLLDEQGEVGGCFNGGELPTTVIVDAHGNIRRRFVGARSLREFEAMIAEAERPEVGARSDSNGTNSVR